MVTRGSMWRPDRGEVHLAVSLREMTTGNRCRGVSAGTLRLAQDGHLGHTKGEKRLDLPVPLVWLFFPFILLAQLLRVTSF